MPGFHAMSVPPLASMLRNMRAWLDKAADREAELLTASLAPDMHPLPRQFQMLSDSAKGMVARVSGTEAPAMPDTEATFAELKERLDKTIAYLDASDPAAFDAGEDREILMTFPNGGGLRMGARDYVASFAHPNFYFHASMAYAILRANGVALGKMDYLAGLAPFMFAPPAA